jgi:hypothetical protein
MYISGQYAIQAGDLASTYVTRYITKHGVETTWLKTNPPDPFRMKMVSLWVARPGSVNPNGIKLVIAIATSDLGRNLDICQRHQRHHYHLVYAGDHRIEQAIIVGVVTSGLAAGDILNWVAQVEKEDGSPTIPVGAGYCNYDGLQDLGPPGELVVISKESAAAGNQTISLQTSAAGIQERIVWMCGLHDDNGAARNSYWVWYDSSLLLTVNRGAVSLTNYHHLSIAVANPTTSLINPDANPLIKYDRFRYPSFTVEALAAGKKAYVRGLVYRLYGCES